jgi:hypothetical protein
MSGGFPFGPAMFVALFIVISAPIALLVALLSLARASDRLLAPCAVVASIDLLLAFLCFGLGHTYLNVVLNATCVAALLFSLFGLWRTAKREKEKE